MTAHALVRRIHIDTDPGLDDLLALALAFASPELRVMALTTVAGNAALEHVTENALAFLELAGIDLPVGRGAAGPLALAQTCATEVHGARGRGDVELPRASERSLPDALDVLRNSLREQRVDAVVALGPLTNLAKLVDEDRSLFERTLIVWMGGSLSGGNVTPHAEFNCYADPRAAATVLESGLDVRVIGLDVTHCVLVREPDLPARIFGSGERGRVLEQILHAMMQAERPTRFEACAPLHDPSAIAAVIDPELFRYENKSLDTDTNEGPQRGRLRERENAIGAKVQFAVEVNHSKVKHLVLDRLAAWSGAVAQTG